MRIFYVELRRFARARPPLASISAQDANMCSPCLTDKGRVIAGFTKTSRDGVFYQPKGRCYIDPRIVTALSPQGAQIGFNP